MADRDNLVYQAKLAEQAERYDGKALAVQWSLQTAPTPPPPRTHHHLHLPPHGSGDAGEAAHMDPSGDRRQNGGDFPSPLEQKRFTLDVFSSSGNVDRLGGRRAPSCAPVCPANIYVHDEPS